METSPYISQTYTIGNYQEVTYVLQACNKETMMNGKVFIIGAGPGDPELLTLKAHRALMEADCVVYDRLVSEEIMEIIPPVAQRYFAGKSCKQKAMTQDEINSLLVTLAQQGKCIVRLKGGDPLLFGRGSEEALELIKHQIPFEIIPGITSAQGCAASVGIPLTHRGLATSVRFFTGHRMSAEDAREELELNWQSLADPDTTLVVYMGLANLDVIATQLIKHGLSPDTPAAAIQEGTTSRQKSVVSNLAGIAAEVKNAAFEPPSLIIIGRVAALAKELGLAV
ncbi:MAG: uroporphyrinogen-III C-methyltransferase [Rickettsiales bacterium]|nr:uroporphyrinogen-III C-methyltransferase [Rickettsiales bacterium]